MGKILRWTLIVILGILVLTWIVYVSGPRPKFEKINTYLPSLQLELDTLDTYIAKQEALVPNIKPGNASEVVWYDKKEKTPYVMLYLHGFSASPAEGDPLHKNLAKKYGCNLYIPRLEGHGIEDRESFADLTPMSYINSAKKALAVAQLLGDTLLIMSCSTGSPMAVYLASEHPDLIHALLMYSPNFAVANPFMGLCTGPWGKDILRAAVGSDYREIPGFKEGEEGKYWTHSYRIEGLIAMQGLLDQSCSKEIFNKISLPYYIGYWYKNEEEKDRTVSIEAIKAFDKQTQTPEQFKLMEAFPDAGAHVITSSLRSKDVESVEASSSRFLEEVIGLVPVEKSEEEVGEENE